MRGHKVARQPVIAWRSMVGGWLLILSAPLFAADYSGQLAWAQRVDLATLVSGVVAEVRVQPGQLVKEGTLLLSLDARAYRARLAMAEAEVKRLSLTKDEADRELERSQELYDRTLLSEHDLQVATIGQSVAAADYKKALARQVQAQLDYEHSRITAPFDCIVLGVKAVKGQSINAQLHSDTLVSVASSEVMLALILVDSQQVGALRLQQPATVRVDGASLDGHIAAIALEADPKGEYSVEVMFNLPSGHILRAGQRADVSIP